MKHFFTYLIFAGVFLSAISSCSNPTSPNGNGNLISNSSFEKFGLPSFSGWTIESWDSMYVKDTPGAAPGGGRWSIWLAPSYCIPDPCFVGGQISTSVTGQSGKDTFTVNVWEKNTSVSAHGAIILWQSRHDSSFGYITHVFHDDSLWKNYNFTASFSLQSADTIFIQLGSSPTNFYASDPPKGIYFDEVVFQRIK